MRFILVILAFSYSVGYAQIGIGFGAYQNGYNRLINPQNILDTLPNSTGQALGLLPGGNVQVFATISEKLALSISSEANIRLYSISTKISPFQGIGSFSFSGNFNSYWALTRPEKLDGAIILGVAGGYQINKSETTYKPSEFKAYPRSWFHTIHGEIMLGLGEVYVHRGVFFRLGFGPNKSSHLQIGIRYNIDVIKRKNVLKQKEAASGLSE